MSLLAVCQGVVSDFMQMKDEEIYLRQLMPPTFSHDAAVTRCIMDLYSRVSASEADYKVCEVAFVFLQLAVKRIEPSKFCHCK